MCFVWTGLCCCTREVALVSGVPSLTVLVVGLMGTWGLMVEVVTATGGAAAELGTIRDCWLLNNDWRRAGRLFWRRKKKINLKLCSCLFCLVALLFCPRTFSWQFIFRHTLNCSNYSSTKLQMPQRVKTHSTNSLCVYGGVKASSVFKQNADTKIWS